MRPGALLLLLTCLAAPAAGCEVPAGAGALRAQALTLTNAARAAAGAPALTRDARLEAVAQTQACRTADRGRVTHRGTWFAGLGRRLRRQGYPYAMAAENLAAGQTTADAVHNAWMTSPEHRRNTLDPRARDVGFGVALASDGWLHWSMVAAAQP